MEAPEFLRVRCGALGEDRIQGVDSPGLLLFPGGEKFKAVLERCGAPVDLEDEFGP